MEEAIRHLDNLAVLGRTVSAIAHEIRNPLTGIAAGIQYLDRSAELNEDHKENITLILAEVDRLNRIITDLFKVAKPRDLLYLPAEMSLIVEKSFKSISDIIDSRKIVFTSNIGSEVPKVEVDPDQITQVLINLIKNAAEAVEEGGHVSVSVRPVDGSEPDMRKVQGKETFIIEVADNGPGIPEENQARVFDPFFTTKAPGEGTGLGLNISHGIVVEKHGGHITVESTPGATLFTVKLPIAGSA